ncbi:MAG: TonB-dependent receptor plug domain-containing protein, partial [Flavobacteriales bacterium]
KLFMNTSLIFSDYQFEFGAGQDEFELTLESGIRDYNLKLDLNWLPDVRHNVQFGGNYIYHIFTPSSVSARTGDTDLDLGGVIKYHAHEAAIYIQDDWDISDRFKINAGVRGSMFAHTGPFDRYGTNEVGQVVDTTKYKVGENVKTYAYAEPRISGRAMLGKHNSIKASYTMNFQYVHLASLASISFPTDLWMPSTDKVKPQEGHQWALGYFHNFFDDKLEVSVEGYYKTMKNLLEYKDGFSPDQNINNNVDNNFVFGKGNSYGAEFFIRKNGKRFNGWLGYTLAWTNRKFDDLNGGNWFPATYDRRHDLSIVGSYKINEHWSVSAVFVYGTGSAMTVPAARYFVNGNIVTEYGDRNAFRMPDYHRLDLGATFNPKQKKPRRFKSTWNFGIYNVYSRQNPYFIYFATETSEEDQSITIEARQVSVFPILPSITWNFKF